MPIRRLKFVITALAAWIVPSIALSQGKTTTSAPAPSLPTLAGMVVTPTGSIPGRGRSGEAATMVPRQVSLTAAVTNPTAMGRDGWCEVTFDRGHAWSRTGGSYANGTCSFPALMLPPGGGPEQTLNLNVRGCNAAGCKESPVWMTVLVDAQPPRVLHPMDHAGVGRGGEMITFSEQLATNMQQKIETAISASADHPVKFAWSQQPVGDGRAERQFYVRVEEVSVPVRMRQSVVVDLADPVGNVTPGAKLIDVPAAVATAELPTLSGVDVTPHGSIPGRGRSGEVATMVPRQVTVSAAVTNPTAMGRDGWCELTVDHGRGWSRTGGTYANGACNFAALTLPGSIDAVKDLNVRGCNTAGCKEGPVYMPVLVDAQPPRLVSPMNHGGVGRGGEMISFSEQLAPDMQQRIETAISASADHPVKFAWSLEPLGEGRAERQFYVRVTEVSAPVRMRQDVVVDLVDPVGNVTPRAKLIDVAADAALLPTLAGVVVTPSAPGGAPGGQPVRMVPRQVVVSAAVTNPTTMGTDGWCEVTQNHGRGWVRTGGTYANGTCNFAAVQLPGGRGEVLDLNLRACNEKAGCKESPVWQSVVVDAAPPTVTLAMHTGGLMQGGGVITFSEALATDMQQRIETAISAAADHPVKFVWTLEPAGTGRPGRELQLRVTSVATPAHIQQAVTLDLVDLVGNVTPGARIVVP